MRVSTCEDLVEIGEGSHPPKSAEPVLKVATKQGVLEAPLVDWLPSFPASTSPATLRQILEDEGVVWLKRALPRDFVLDFRRR